MKNAVDYRLLARFEASRRRNARPAEEKLEWLERLRVRTEGRTEPAPAEGALLQVRALDLRD
ncbi:MAG: hypothetical protein ACXVRJ_12130 [Gaiellaceae bacterium]